MTGQHALRRVDSLRVDSLRPTVDTGRHTPCLTAVAFIWQPSVEDALARGEQVPDDGSHKVQSHCHAPHLQQLQDDDTDRTLSPTVCSAGWTASRPLQA